MALSIDSNHFRKDAEDRFPIEVRSATAGDGPDGDIDALARAMIMIFSTNAAFRATLRSNAFFALACTEPSMKWKQVSQEIESIQAEGNDKR